jgi:hypothetical protein
MKIQVRASGPIHRPEVLNHIHGDYRDSTPTMARVLAESEGQHIYQYIGTVKSRATPGTKTQLPFEVGEIYKSPRWQRSYKCIAIGSDQVFWESLAATGYTFRTCLDGSDFNSGIATIEPEYSKSPGTVEYYVDETGA